MKMKVIKNFKAREGLQAKFEADTIRDAMMNDGVVAIPFDILAGELMDVVNPIFVPNDCYEEIVATKVKPPKK